MNVLTTEQIDRELASRTAEAADISAALVALDNHPGLAHVRRYPPAGITAQRWKAVERSLGQMWDDFGRLTSMLESVQAVRARGTKLDDDERAELTRLLSGPAEPPRPRKLLVQNTNNGSHADAAGFAAAADRIRAAYPAVAEFLDAVDEIDSLIAHGLAPSQKRLDAAGAAGPKALAVLLTDSATDPLSLTPQVVEERIRDIADEIGRREAELTELAAIKDDWPAALAAATSLLDTLHGATRQAADTRAHAEQLVLTAPLPTPADTEPALRADLRSLASADAAALRSLRQRIETALNAIRDSEVLAQGLLDRRGELKGRLTAYQAKAARLGLGEDRDLLACSRIAAGLLSRQPCDLRAVTRAITDYRQLIAEKQGESR